MVEHQPNRSIETLSGYRGEHSTQITPHHTSGCGRSIGTYFPSRSKLSSAEWAYLAGLFDGEGCINVKCTERVGGRRRWQLSLDICNTHRGVLEWVRDTLGVGWLYSEEREPPHRRRFNWRSEGASKLATIIQGMEPYLIIKHSQAMLALKFLALVKPIDETRGHLISPADWEVRVALATSLREQRSLEWSPIPKKLKETDECLCGASFIRKSATQIYCNKRCPNRLEWMAALRKAKRGY